MFSIASPGIMLSLQAAVMSRTRLWWPGAGCPGQLQWPALERPCSAGPGCLLIAVPPVPHPCPGSHHNVCQAQLIFTRHPGLSVALRSSHSEDVQQWALAMSQPSWLIAIRISLLDAADCYNFPCVSNIQSGTWMKPIFPDITQNLLLQAVRHKTWTCLEWEIYYPSWGCTLKTLHLVTHTNIEWLRVGPTLHHWVSSFSSSWSKQEPQHHSGLGSVTRGMCYMLSRVTPDQPSLTPAQVRAEREQPNSWSLVPRVGSRAQWSSHGSYLDGLDNTRPRLTSWYIGDKEVTRRNGREQVILTIYLQLPIVHRKCGNLRKDFM